MNGIRPRRWASTPTLVYGVLYTVAALLAVIDAVPVASWANRHAAPLSQLWHNAALSHFWAAHPIATMSIALAIFSVGALVASLGEDE